jgi:hypothetical protein
MIPPRKKKKERKEKEKRKKRDCSLFSSPLSFLALSLLKLLSFLQKNFFEIFFF